MPSFARRAVVWWQRHDRIVLTVALLSLAALGGLIGAGDQHPFRGESFESKQVVVTPDGEEGVRVTEVVDIDFGRHGRHGYQRRIPNDFGVPTNVEATSTANAELDVAGSESPSGDTRIRIGSAAETSRGHQRYVLSYTLPDAHLDEGRLYLDIIGTDDVLSTDHFEVWLVGFDISATECHRGWSSASGGCEFEQVDDRWRADLGTLDAGDGVTVDAAVDGRTEIAMPDRPDRPASVVPNWRLAGAIVLVSAATLVLLYLFGRWYGMNRAAKGGATNAAFTDAAAAESVPSRLVADSRLEDLAPIEFEPPRSLRPWQGAVAVNEAVDERSIVAWFSEFVAAGLLTVDEHQGARLRRTDVEVGDSLAKRFRFGEFDKNLFERTFPEPGSTIALDSHSERLSTAWRRVASHQESFASRSGWWRRNPPTYRSQRSGFRPNWAVISFVAVVWSIAMWSILKTVSAPLVPFSYLFSNPIFILVIAAAGTVAASWFNFAALHPARSVLGTAAALRTLAFRRFLTVSEGEHVERAWDRSRIREYSAWAVALGASVAWSERIDLIAPPGEPLDLSWITTIDPIHYDLDSTVSNFSASHHEDRANPWRAVGRFMAEAAENSGSGGGGSSYSGGGGFGGGSVGGGGGGGSSGSW